MFTSLDHLVIKVDDLGAAEADYTALLGRTPSWRGTHPALGTSNALYRLENTYIELLYFPDDVVLPFGAGGDNEGLIAVALGTPDIGSARQSLIETGSSPSDVVEGSGTESSTGVERKWRTMFLDPRTTRSISMFVIQHLSPDDALPIAPAVRDAPAERVDHFVIAAGDADASVSLFRDTFGLDLRLDRSFPDWGMRLAFFKVGGVTLELAHRLDGDPSPVDRLWGISYRVNDVSAAREHLLAQGFDVSEVRDGRRPGTRVLTVRSRTHGVATLMLST